MGIAGEKKLILESNNYKGEIYYKFIDISTRKPLINSVGKEINVFEECSLITILPNEKNYKKYKIIYNDFDSTTMLLKFKGQSIISSLNIQEEGIICPTLMWTDGNHGSYTAMPFMNVTKGCLVKSWELKQEETAQENQEYAELLGSLSE